MPRSARAEGSSGCLSALSPTSKPSHFNGHQTPCQTSLSYSVRRRSVPLKSLQISPSSRTLVSEQRRGPWTRGSLSCWRTSPGEEGGLAGGLFNVGNEQAPGEGWAGFPAPTVTSEPHVPPGPQSGPQGQCVHGPPGTRSGRGLPAAGAAGPEVLPLGPAWGAGRPAPERQAPGRRALRGGAASVDGDWERHLLTNENVTESTE